MRRYVLTLDLKDDVSLIAEYEQWHREVWPEVEQSILASGIRRMEIYRFSNRLVMILDADEQFSFERKAMVDEANPHVQEWERLMWKYQQPVPGAKQGEKWTIMNKIFEISGNGV
ncbi:L-rhamnose mutarotase [Parapedobacter deserti]|uniref:L-rhamnose mutarotase n=1 Tax=Parapedobacter deserti TaxID=1912957 RepID=A0ABV7JFS5_9SPHI